MIDEAKVGIFNLYKQNEQQKPMLIINTLLKYIYLASNLG
jgi:hypothetical protein